MNTLINNPIISEVSFNAKSEIELKRFCKENANKDTSIDCYSFDYTDDIFVYSMSEKNNDYIKFDNYFFQIINKEKSLYLLLDSKLTDLEDKPDPETSSVIYYQPKAPIESKIIEIDLSIASSSLKKITCGEFPGYSIKIS